MIQAIVFDLFGTLVYLGRDSHPYLRLCRAVGVGRRVRESLSSNAEDLKAFSYELQADPPADIGRLSADLEADIRSAKLFPDVIQTLEKLRQQRLPLAIISNLAAPYRSVVSTLGISEYLTAAIYSCDVGYCKPDPAIYKVAQQALGKPAANTLMVGDSYRCDVQGPAAYGMKSILLNRKKKVSNDASISSLDEVLAWTD